MYFTHRLAGLFLAAGLLVGCGSTASNTTPPAPTAVAESSTDTSQEAAAAEAEAAAAEAEAAAAAAAAAEAETAAAAEAEAASIAPTLSDNAITTESGLRYEEIVVGEGLEVGPNAWVTVEYNGYLEDGTVVESSYWYDDAYVFFMGVGQVIDGWEEGLAGMRQGGARRLLVPAELAYGAEGAQYIPADSPVIFDVEILAVEPLPDPSEAEQYKVTENGIRYAILEEGEGDATAEMGHIVTFDYDGWTDNGVMFYRSGLYDAVPELTLGDSSIDGLNEGMVGMKVGEIRQLQIPAALAYAEDGADGFVPPDTDIIIEVQLHSTTETPTQASVEEDDLEKTDSGLQYAILEEGKGAEAKEGTLVSANYSGWLEDGTLFDSSIFHQGPFVFTLGQGEAIAGWDEGLAGMKVGEKRQLRVPAALAYGDAGYYEMVPANANLVFDVELVDVQ